MDEYTPGSSPLSLNSIESLRGNPSLGRMQAWIMKQEHALSGNGNEDWHAVPVPVPVPVPMSARLRHTTISAFANIFKLLSQLYFLDPVSPLYIVCHSYHRHKPTLYTRKGNMSSHPYKLILLPILTVLILTPPQCSAYVNWIYPTAGSNSLTYNYIDTVYFTWQSDIIQPKLGLWCSVAGSGTFLTREWIFPPSCLPPSLVHPSLPSYANATL
jgi:hypothetical protein